MKLLPYYDVDNEDDDDDDAADGEASIGKQFCSETLETDSVRNDGMNESASFANSLSGKAFSGEVGCVYGSWKSFRGLWNCSVKFNFLRNIQNNKCCKYGNCFLKPTELGTFKY